MADNLKLQQEINKLVAQRQKMLQQETAHLEKQLQLAQEMQKALQDMTMSGAAVDELNELNDALEEAANEAGELGASAEEVFSEIADGMDKNVQHSKNWREALGKIASDFPVLATVAAGALDGVVSGFRLSINMAQSLIGFIGSVTSGFFSIGKAVLAIPFRIFNGLVEMAKTGGGGTELMQAFEDVRKEFGSFRQATGRDVISSMRNMQGELANTGLSVYRIFGQLHERLTFFRELAVAMGPVFGILGQNMAENAEFIGAFQKGLGVAHEDMKAFGELAIRSGKPINEVLRETANYSLQLGEKFGISQKLIAKDITKMVKNVGHFGNITQKEMATAAVYTRKLGLEIEALGGILDKYDNFETAAEGVADMARYFGASLDVFELTQAQSGAERLELMRQSFFAAGNDANRLSRVELKKLADAVGGLSAEQAKLAFSSENVGMSFEEITASSEKAEKKQVTQQEAMVKLADSIERLVRQGQLFEGGFFAHFFKGFEIGLKRSREFWGLMRNIRKSLMVTLYEGIKFGRSLPKVFPAVGELFGGLRDAFDPKRFRQAFGGLRVALQDFFKDIGKGVSGEKAISNMFEKFHDTFMKFFGGQSGPMKRISNAMFEIGMVIVKGFTGTVPVVMKGLAKAITMFADFLTDPKAFFDAMKKAGDVTKGPKQAFLSALGEAWKAIEKSWPQLRDSIVKLFGVVRKKVEPWFKKNGPVIVKGFLAFMFGPAVIGGVLKGLLAGTGALLTRVVGGAFLGGGKKAATKIGPAMTGAAGKMLGPLAGAAVFATASMGINKGLDKYKKSTLTALDKKFGPGNDVEAKAGAAAAGIFDTFTFGLVPPDVSQKMAERVGEISKSLFEAVGKTIGENFSRKLRDYAGGSIDVAGSIGGMLGAAFEKDPEKFKTEFKKFLVALPGQIWNAIAVSLMVAGGVAAEATVIGSTIAQGIWSAIADAVRSGEKIPIAGPIFGAIADGLDTFADMIGTFGKTIKGLAGWLLGGKSFFEAMKESGVAETGVSKWLQKNFFKPIATTVLDVVGAFMRLKARFEFIWQAIKNVFQTAWDSIKNVWSSTIVGSWFGKTTGSITNSFTGAWDAIKNVWGAAKSWFFAKVIDPIASAFDNIKTSIVKTLDKLWDSMVGSFEKGKERIGGVMKLIGRAIFEPLVKAFKKVNSLLPAEMQAAIAGVKDAFGIRSPSRIFVDIGKNMVKGLSIGTEKLPQVMSSRAEALLVKAKDIGVASDMIKSKIDNNRNKLINLKAELQRAGDGLEANKTITIKKPDYSININLKAVMDAGTVEKVLIERPGSELVTVSRPGG